MSGSVILSGLLGSHQVSTLSSTFPLLGICLNLSSLLSASFHLGTDFPPKGQHIKHCEVLRHYGNGYHILSTIGRLIRLGHKKACGKSWSLLCIPTGLPPATEPVQFHSIGAVRIQGAYTQSTPLIGSPPP